MAYITTQTKNSGTMLWSTSPTRLLNRGETLKKDITMQQLQSEAELTEIDLEQCKCILVTKTTAKEKLRMAVEQ